MGSARVEMPASISVSEASDVAFTMIRRWRGASPKVFGVDAAVLLFGVMVVVSVTTLAGLGAAGKLGEGWPIGVACALTTYLCLTAVIDRTTISIRDGALRVSHGPLPWSRGRSVPSAEIARLEVRASTTNCGVHAVLRDDTNVPLLSYGKFAALRDIEAAFIVHELRSRLGLHEPPVLANARPRTA